MIRTTSISLKNRNLKRNEKINENIYGAISEYEHSEMKNLNLKPITQIKINKANPSIIKRISKFKNKCTTPNFAFDQGKTEN